MQGGRRLPRTGRRCTDRIGGSLWRAWVQDGGCSHAGLSRTGRATSSRWPLFVMSCDSHAWRRPGRDITSLLVRMRTTPHNNRLTRVGGDDTLPLTLDVHTGLFDDDLDAVAERLDAAHVTPMCPEATVTDLDKRRTSS
jgi:hypothetical protein